MTHQYIIAHADKAVLKLSGVEVRGLDTRQLEEQLSRRLETTVRVIGVTGDHIEMDVYDLDPEQVRTRQGSIVEAISLTEGISATDLLQMSCSEKILAVDIDRVPPKTDCAAERWVALR